MFMVKIKIKKNIFNLKITNLRFNISIKEFDLDQLVEDSKQKVSKLSQKEKKNNEKEKQSVLKFKVCSQILYRREKEVRENEIETITK